MKPRLAARPIYRLKLLRTVERQRQKHGTVCRQAAQRAHFKREPTWRITVMPEKSRFSVFSHQLWLVLDVLNRCSLQISDTFLYYFKWMLLLNNLGENLEIGMVRHHSCNKNHKTCAKPLFIGTVLCTAPHNISPFLWEKGNSQSHFIHKMEMTGKSGGGSEGIVSLKAAKFKNKKKSSNVNLKTLKEVHWGTFSSPINPSQNSHDEKSSSE